MTTSTNPVLTLLHADRSPLLLGELGTEFLTANSIGPSAWERPFRVELEPQTSKRGNVFFTYDQRIPLPDRLDTRLQVDEVLLDALEHGVSKRGNPTRRHAGSLELRERAYDLTAYVTVTRAACWVKVHAQVHSGRRVEGSSTAPRGGKLV
jgi:hypothetical protein